MIRVVVIEDEYHLRQELVLTTPWERWGCTLVGEADNGLTGERLIHRVSPEIVLADIRMPGQDGLEMMRRARGAQAGSHRSTDPVDGSLPLVIFLTGYDEFEYARAALRIGAFDFLLKPVDDDELDRVLNAAVRAVTSRADPPLDRQQHAKPTSRLVAPPTNGPPSEWTAFDAESPEERSTPTHPQRPSGSWEARPNNHAIEESAEHLEPRSVTGHRSPHIASALTYLHEHFAGDVGLAEVADHVGLSAAYLSRRFSAESGYTVMEYLTRVRIRHAAHLLCRDDLQIKEIMLRSGYHDAGYFGRVFRRLLGMSPSEFQRRHAHRVSDEEHHSR